MNEQIVSDYYGKVLQSSADLKTDACCTTDDIPPFHKALLTNIHDEVMAKYYGCGLIAPLALEGARVLDLGSGSGRDAYALAQMAGADGEIVGVDMTDEQLAVANAHREWHAEKFGYANVRFEKGFIEQLDRLDLEPGSFDVVVSNCVINLSMDKPAVLAGVKRLLKPGGEFFFSDVYADRRLPQAVREDPVLFGECLGGALYWNDFLTLSKQAGFADPRLVTDRPLAVENLALQEKLGRARFFSATYSLFNIDGLEPSCEDYGQAVIYDGSIDHAGDTFIFDAHHVIEAGKVFPVCGNTYRMLKESRFADAFDFIGSRDRHYGIFEGCGTQMPFSQGANARSNVTCC
ncbi:methyltransferase domain-containing protein [Aquisalinus flavus]|uniref:Arsenite methyltransferase n=1 Tax=Aquisalinus flavus TaxID=1526572 RepID=A0A8J2V2I3_9PROT|nr:methyltransferase domain-containing protein [Aquisalinus flavus]MBD0426148.1 methyltransferase domain-containing protein [Aquisalinus flavus]UNE48271.1 methyltransferase domain-containing protein [Aquisalinus flavus]GGD10198.1 methyltransferase [Aquisalinus flavus]